MMLENPEHSEYLDIIVKYLTGETSEKEEQRLHDWLKEAPSHKEVFSEYKKVWDNMDKVKGQTTDIIDQEWKIFESRIDSIESNKKSENIKSASSGFNFMRIAASIALIIFAGIGIFVVTNVLNKEKIASGTEIQEIELSDGSEVTLNRNTVIKYSQKFKERRMVYLEGEAFFDIKHNPDKPFIVNTNEIQVEVIGTRFTVNAYPEKNNIEVVVSSGKVAVSSERSGSEQLYLTEGEKAVYHKNNNALQKSTKLDQNYLAWKTKILTFENQRLSEVIKTLNSVYSINIQLMNAELKDCTITTTFNQQSIEAVLNVISSTLGLEVQKGENRIEIYGEGC